MNKCNSHACILLCATFGKMEMDTAHIHWHSHHNNLHEGLFKDTVFAKLYIYVSMYRMFG